LAQPGAVSCLGLALAHMLCTICHKDRCIRLFPARKPTPVHGVPTSDRFGLAVRNGRAPLHSLKWGSVCSFRLVYPLPFTLETALIVPPYFLLTLVPVNFLARQSTKATFPLTLDEIPYPINFHAENKHVLHLINFIRMDF
jgi:hypothetical protein